MQKVKSKDTQPEMIVRKFLFSRGFRFGLHSRSLPGKPDIVLKKYKAIIFVHGCLWHGHKNCKRFIMPKKRLEYWQPKIVRNILRNKQVKRELKKLGWRVFEVWQCQLNKTKREKTLLALEAKIIR